MPCGRPTAPWPAATCPSTGPSPTSSPSRTLRSPRPCTRRRPLPPRCWAWTGDRRTGLGRMAPVEVVIVPGREEAGRVVGDAIVALLDRKPDAVLGLATG